MNGPHIRIRWIFLSNFHIENIFIRVTVYFFMDFLSFKHILELFTFTEMEYDVSMT